jgi:hypothetical protein
MSVFHAAVFVPAPLSVNGKRKIIYNQKKNGHVAQQRTQE